MGLTSIDDVHATGRGLQHGFGVAHAVNLTPLPQLQKWLGHEDIDTTVIYMQATDDEKCSLTASVWNELLLISKERKVRAITGAIGC